MTFSLPIIITLSLFGAGLLTSICLQIATLVSLIVLHIVDSKKRSSELRPLKNGELIRRIETTPMLRKRSKSTTFSPRQKFKKNSDSDDIETKQLLEPEYEPLMNQPEFKN